MPAHVILDLSGAALEAATLILASGGKRAAAFGRALDRVPVAAFAVGLATPPSQAKDCTVFASFLLAATRTSRVIVRVDPARQHPVNVARTVSTLSALHDGRIGVGMRADTTTEGWFCRGDGARQPTAADCLRLLSSLWDSWPLDAIVGDQQAGRYVDAQRIVRVSDPAYPGIGGPLTLPTDVTAKPPLLLVHSRPGDAQDGVGIDLHLLPANADADGTPGEADEFVGAGVRLVLGLPDLDALLAWRASPDRPAEPTEAVAASIRAALGLGSSQRIAHREERVFQDAMHAVRV